MKKQGWEGIIWAGAVVIASMLLFGCDLEETEKEPDAEAAIEEALEKKYGQSFQLYEGLDHAGGSKSYLIGRGEDGQKRALVFGAKEKEDGTLELYGDNYFQYYIEDELKEALEELVPENFPKHRLDILYSEELFPNELTKDSDLDDLKETAFPIPLGYAFYMYEEDAEKVDLPVLANRLCRLGREKKLTGRYEFFSVKKRDFSDLDDIPRKNFNDYYGSGIKEPDWAANYMFLVNLHYVIFKEGDGRH